MLALERSRTNAHHSKFMHMSDSTIVPWSLNYGIILPKTRKTATHRGWFIPTPLRRTKTSSRLCPRLDLCYRDIRLTLLGCRKQAAELPAGMSTWTPDCLVLIISKRLLRCALEPTRICSKGKLNTSTTTTKNIEIKLGFVPNTLKSV